MIFMIRIFFSQMLLVYLGVTEMVNRRHSVAYVWINLIRAEMFSLVQKLYTRLDRAR